MKRDRMDGGESRKAWTMMKLAALETKLAQGPDAETAAALLLLVRHDLEIGRLKLDILTACRFIHKEPLACQLIGEIMLEALRKFPERPRGNVCTTQA